MQVRQHVLPAPLNLHPLFFFWMPSHPCPRLQPRCFLRLGLPPLDTDWNLYSMTAEEAAPLTLPPAATAQQATGNPAAGALRPAAPQPQPGSYADLAAYNRSKSLAGPPPLFPSNVSGGSHAVSLLTYMLFLHGLLLVVTNVLFYLCTPLCVAFFAVQGYTQLAHTVLPAKHWIITLMDDWESRAVSMKGPRGGLIVGVKKHMPEVEAKGERPLHAAVHSFTPLSKHGYSYLRLFCGWCLWLIMLPLLTLLGTFLYVCCVGGLVVTLYGSVYVWAAHILYALYRLLQGSGLPQLLQCGREAVVEPGGDGGGAGANVGCRAQPEGAGVRGDDDTRSRILSPRQVGSAVDKVLLKATPASAGSAGSAASGGGAIVGSKAQLLSPGPGLSGGPHGTAGKVLVDVQELERLQKQIAELSARLVQVGQLVSVRRGWHEPAQVGSPPQPTTGTGGGT